VLFFTCAWLGLNHIILNHIFNFSLQISLAKSTNASMSCEMVSINYKLWYCYATAEDRFNLHLGMLTKSVTLGYILLCMDFFCCCISPFLAPPHRHKLKRLFKVEELCFEMIVKAIEKGDEGRFFLLLFLFLQQLLSSLTQKHHKLSQKHTFTEQQAF